MFDRVIQADAVEHTCFREESGGRFPRGSKLGDDAS
jgi:hypothetical protein